MKFNFKIQQYQTDAVENTVSVFTGQPSRDNTLYRRDLGKKVQGTITYDEDYSGYRNTDIELTDAQLFEKIRTLQSAQDIPESKALSHDLGRVGLDIEMETGTGKTYVYIKTMFELNKRYGWSKFIVVVPSIAIREGVYKSFCVLEDHFMEHYGKKARFFIYNSSNLQQLDSFSSDAGINVMIINTQAFASSLKEGAKNKESRIIYSERDDFGSRKPIDVLAANRPIIIMDEPQKMEGEATQTALKRFKPLFVLYYSATHKTSHNCIYALDALDAYKQKLVKKIQVKGFEVKNLKGTSSYLYLDDIILSKNQPPQARIELEVSGVSGIRKESHRFDLHDTLQATSGLAQYDGFTISEIDAYRDSVTFLNGVTVRKGEVYGDSSLIAMQRVQIRETIASHFEKEHELFKQGIKTLSLFFIDEVANYKSYNSEGEEVHGPFWKIFEEEYTNYLNDNLTLFDDSYQAYLRRFDASQVHNGYFSIDKKTGRSIDSETKRGSDLSDDISAYELILKNKERLLSFDEPCRFIFSHSALREGWDNPNVFQICTLRHASSAVAKRQEVGRGLRLCVDQSGNRMDFEELGDNVQEVNKLTVIANESYKDFVDGLQKETREALRVRPTKADTLFFQGKVVERDGIKTTIDPQEAVMIHSYLIAYGYVDKNNKITQLYKDDKNNGTLQPMFPGLAPIESQVHTIIQSLFDESVVLDEMIEDGHATTIQENKLNENFKKKEFQALWKEINQKYVYTVHYDSEELIRKAITSINANLMVTELKYIMTSGDQESVDEFGNLSTKTKTLSTVSTSSVRYDLVGEIARRTTLTRKSACAILKGLRPTVLSKFNNNPEEFIREVSKLIKNEKATMIVEHIKYNKLDETYDSDIFTQEKSSQPISKAYLSSKAIQDYVFTDGYAEESTEKKFAKALDAASEVCVYAKLPRSFQIPTPVGNYSPDWAIAFNQGTVKHIYFIAETKGSMDSMQMKKVEDAKIKCAEKLFNYMPSSNVRYHEVDSYEKLIDVMKNID
ncbi:MAG: DEAD/DEAH box helicase family protein [Bacteroidales bacterium]|nr:DEAD/DEAH box helicase family protein [Bacteroidales bacterium]